MFYASYVDKEGNAKGHIYADTDEYLRDLADSDPLDIVPFKVCGCNYAQRQASVRGVAIQYQNAEVGDMFMSEYADVTAWFTKMGKRYGLTEEFKENGVI